MLRSQFASSRFWERPRAGWWVVLGVLLAALSLGSAHAGETHYLEARLEPSQGLRQDFGRSVDIDRRTAVVAQPGFCDSLCYGGAFVFEFKHGLWKETALLQDGGIDAVIANNVALSGDSIAVSQNDEGNGVVTVYQRTDRRFWSRTATLLFGFREPSIDLYGSRLAIGSNRYISAVRVYEQDHENPSQWNRILDVTEPLADFGDTVAIEGGTLAAGTMGDVIAGVVYDEAATGDWWSTDLPPCLQCGFSLAIDSPHLVVGGAEGENRVEVFQRINGSWFPDGTLTGGLDITRFGESVAISRNVIAVGDPEADAGAGRVTLCHEKDGEWLEAATILPPPDTVQFGTAVALSGDRLLVGAPETGAFGAAFVYRLCRSTTGIADTCHPPERGSTAIR